MSLLKGKIAVFTGGSSGVGLPEQRKFRRALAAGWAFLQVMESTSFDYTLDRIERLEREVERLKEEMRRSRNPEAVDDHNASATALDP